jgi:glycosyltransferase 2 family protein
MQQRADWRERGRALLSGSRVLYTPLALAFLAYVIFSDEVGLRARLAQADSWLIVKVFLLVACGHGFIVLCSYLLFRSQGAQPGLGQVWHIHVSRLPARYLPGGVWQTVSRALDFSAHGLARATILRVLILEMVLSTGLAAVLGVSLLLAAGDLKGVSYLSIFLLFGIAELWAAPWLVSMLSKDHPRFAAARYVAAIAAFALVWLLYGIAFYQFVGAVLPGIDWPRAMGVYLLSWAAGFLAFFAPQGIGVFEVVSSYLLTGELAAGVVASMFAFRALTMLSDLGVWGIYRLWLLVQGGHRVGPPRN